jgi:hypothetical protein
MWILTTVSEEYQIQQMNGKSDLLVYRCKAILQNYLNLYKFISAVSITCKYLEKFLVFSNACLARHTIPAMSKILVHPANNKHITAATLILIYELCTK